MESNACRKPLRRPPWRRSAAYNRLSPPAIHTATDVDHELLGGVAEHFERQIRWNLRSMAFGLLLGMAAFVVALFTAQPLARWPLLAAAMLELSFVPWYTALTCRRLRRAITFIALDLKCGLVGEGDGKVRSLLGVWRVVQDARTGRLRRLPTGAAALANVPVGAIVGYRFALRSGVVLNIECRGESDDDAPNGNKKMKPAALTASDANALDPIRLARIGEGDGELTCVTGQ